MASSSNPNGATRSSTRIRVLASREVKPPRFLNPFTGDRPRTRGQKAALDHAAGRRQSGNLLDSFRISKPGSTTAAQDFTKLATDGAGTLDDDLGNSDAQGSINDGDYPIFSDRGASGRPRRGTSKMTSRKKSAKRQRVTTRSRAAAQKGAANDSHNVWGNATPDWLTPALQVFWPEVFRYAASDSVGLKQGWLLQMATVCTAFCRPALAVLYDSPRITSDNKMQKLIATLSLSDTLYYYRSKIHSLHLGPEFLPKDTTMKTLISLLPRLKHVSVTHELDQPPYRHLDMMGRRTDPEFWRILDDRMDSRAGMIEKPSPILSWKWSGRLLPDFLLASEGIIRLHTVGPLQDLTKLHLVNFPPLWYDATQSQLWGEDFNRVALPMGPPLPEYGIPIEEHVVAGQCSRVMNSLGHLEHLVLEACCVSGELLLPSLPHRLKHLEITHCWNVLSEHLGPFLVSHGQDLVTLILNHNSALDLGFLVDLGKSCPKLEKLVVNMACYKSPETHSADPEFELALEEGAIPTWPSSLRHVELVHVRPWTPDAAVMLLDSLINSARDLPNLRYLVVKSMLDLGWRQRAELKTEWLGRLQAVFLRPPSKPPTPIRSLPKPAPAPPVAATKDNDELAGSKRNKARPRPGATPTPASAPAPATRRSRRISGHHSDDSTAKNDRKRPMYVEPPSDPEEDADGEFSDDNDDSDAELSDALDIQPPGSPRDDDETFVQGLCERVELMIENHKLAEVQFDMDDFMDASPDSAMSDPDFSS
ncbi:uncharacterized protein DNG_08321 [Cephalotrichum gorgonifer]|uniref:Uncharacterized protein n=1 Tax=Cephalotrichum gorgonifer TaxID=2041049 RepID=A0AAE8N4U6_9PEZI|nr:uncharacterized protein DNG_08321 [Cephalotrichum gorgonifer]